MAVQLIDVSAILEKIIQPSVYDQLLKKAIAWRIFGGALEDEQGAVTNVPRLNASVTAMHNDSFYIPVRLTRHSGVIAIAEGNSLVSGKPTLQQAQVYAKWQTGTFNITKQTLAVKETGSVVNIFKEYGKMLARDMYQDFNRQVYGDGSGGIRATAGSGSSSTTLTLQAGINNDIDYADYFPPNSYLKIGTGGSAVQVSAKAAKNQLTLASAQTWNGGTMVYKCDASGNAAAEFSGLGLMVKTSGSYLGIDPATYPQWVAAMQDVPAGYVALTLDDMNGAYFAANRLGQGIDVILMNANLFRKYGSLLQTYAQFPEPKTIWGGWKSLEYMGGNAVVVLDYDCPDDMVYFLSSKDLTLGELSPFQFEKGTDGTLLRVSGKLEYEVVATWFGNIATFVRGAHAVLTRRTGVAIS